MGAGSAGDARTQPILRRFRHTAWLPFLVAACTSARPGAGEPIPTGVLAAAESVYLDLRDVRDRIDVARFAGGRAARDGTPIPALARRHDVLRLDLVQRLGRVDSSALAAADARAFGTMRAALARDLAPLADSTPGLPPSEKRPPCDYSPAVTGERRDELDSLRRRVYACYGWAQQHVVLDGDTTDRLSIFGALGRTGDPLARRRLFLSLEPVWRSINADNGPASPYRRLIALEVATRTGRESSVAEQARRSGVPPDSVEGWLMAILETWRDANPDSLIEPWDWHYVTGRAGRVLGGKVPRERLESLNAEVYRSVGADLRELNVRYDLEPREGKDPVAFCTFGARPRLRDGAWTPGEPSVFATYRTGGLDNLAELLHETGHAIHIAAIRTRPAFADWPDSDPFTEAVADFVALDVTEPVWQVRWLGDSVPLADGLRSRYGAIVLDVAWSLLELRMLRDPTTDPNAEWSRITHDYLRIRSHPELSWWAMRGQLVDAPGYMMNYAVGAMIVAALRARTIEAHGPFVTGDHTWYRWVSRQLLRFGLERSTGDVLEEFLGGPVTPAALLKDMRRMND